MNVITSLKIRLYAVLWVSLLLFLPNTAAAETYVSGNITANTTWTKTESPYIVEGDVRVYLNSTTPATLTIEPGTIVRFTSNGRLILGYSSHKGALIAQGTAEEPIIFTSNAASPAPGDWRCIYFDNDTHDATTLMEHCIVEYGGRTENANIYCNKANPQINNCQIHSGSGHGIFQNNSSAGINNNMIENNASTGITIAGSSSPHIENNTIENNGTTGISISGSSNPGILNNTIRNNTSHGIYSSDTNSQPVISGNQIENNGGSAIQLQLGNVQSVSENYGSGNGQDYINITGSCQRNLTLQNLTETDFPWVITNDTRVYLNSTTPATLTIEPGNIVRFTSNGRLILGYSSHKGALIAQGTAEEPIIFTSNTASPAPGDWRCIYFDNDTHDATTLMEHCIVEYGGRTENANIYCNKANPQINNCQIHSGSGHGIFQNNSSAGINNNMIENNASTGINITGSSSPHIENNTIENNGTTGFSISGSSNPGILNNTIRNNTSHGIYSSDTNSQPVISGNQIENNGGSAIQLQLGNVQSVSENYGSGNGQDYINITGSCQRNLTLQNLTETDFPWVITNDTRVYLNSTTPATLTIEPGTIVRFTSNGRLILGYSSHKGALIAQGTAEEPIIFTSNTASPAPGDWRCIYFDNDTHDATTLMEHCIVEYGGRTENANIYCNKANPQINNCQIHSGSGHGIFQNNSSAGINNNMIENNASTGINITGSSSPHIENNTIENNGTTGISISGSSNPGILNNTIRNNTSHGIYSSDTNSQPVISGNQIENNGGSAIQLQLGNVQSVSENYGSGNGQDYINITGSCQRNLTLQNLTETDFPWVITNDTRVYLNSTTPATLTIEPGTIVRFTSNGRLILGYSSYKGALIAQGTAEEPIIFTSNAASPAPGDWRCIYFDNDTHDATTLMEHCIVEYGGKTHNANIYIYNSKPVIQYNTIRNSSHSGIYINGTGCNNVPVNCNNLKDNYYGIYVTGNALPQIEGNNFVTNRNYGIYNSSSVTVVAENNWWNDAQGPNHNGDTIYGTVDFDPFLTQGSDCINTPPTNSPPLDPRNPTPADNAVRVPVLEEGQPAPVLLKWIGGDPNPWDVVVYDVYFGTDTAQMALVAENLGVEEFSVDGLSQGTTYFWQVIARDDTSDETAGPIWQFTTLGDPPDLSVTDITWDISEPIAAGQTLTLTATIENIGTGPVVDSFKIQCKIDGVLIGEHTINPVIPVNGTVEKTFTWTTKTGDHTVEVIADTAGTVDEIYEQNNSLLVDLPTIYDTIPPELTATRPTDGDAVIEVNEITFTLHDPYGNVDDTAVIAGVEVKNSAETLIVGTVTESDDTFTFTPDVSPLPNDTYTVYLTAVDDSSNTENYSFSFTADNLAPGNLTVTGGTVLSGVIQPRPFANQSDTTTITLEGTREDETSLWINGAQKVSTGSNDWSIDLTLYQGDNELEIWLEDMAGNISDSLWVDIRVDSIAPVVTSISPSNNTFFNVPPSTVVVNYEELISGINPGVSTYTVKNDSQIQMPGTWSDINGNQLVFTPNLTFAESYYAIDIQLTDHFGNAGVLIQYHFTVDTTLPDAPIVDPVTSPAYNPNQVITGEKENYAAVYIGGSQVVGHTADSQWSYTALLSSGTNEFAFTAVDRAGNISEETSVTIFYDDIPPLPVTTLTADGDGPGTTVKLNWTGYDESIHGDIDYYRIYVQSSTADDVSDLTVHDTVDSGTFTYTVENLTKGTTYWFAVVPVDFMGHADNYPDWVSAAPTDDIPPENVTGLTVISDEDRLSFSWSPSANTAGDLAGYKAVFSANADDVILAADQSSYEALNLSPASGYTFAVYAFDADGNHSSGRSLTAATLMSNPGGVSATAYDGYVNISWNSVSPADLVQHYAVYLSTDPAMTDVSAMTPRRTTTGTSAKIAGLANHQTYYFAVTTVNISNGERTEVIPVSATPVPDEQGPDISGITFEGQPLVNAMVVDSPGNLTLQACDSAGISHVEFYLDQALIRTDFAAPYTCYLDILSLEDGAHTLLFKAYDTLGNVTEAFYTIEVALLPPGTPDISYPMDGMVTNKTQITVTGTAEKHSVVTLFLNDIEQGTVTADASGNFTFTLTLAEGENRVQASAANRSGSSPLSAAITVTLDTTIPQAPLSLNAQSKSAGQIRLSWQSPPDTEIKGYNLYRSPSSFTSAAGATKINSSPVSGTLHTDLPPADGTYYYRATTIDTADNESELSEEVFAESDNTAPRALGISYFPDGNYDPETNTMAPGRVDLVLTASEPLAATPFLSITPEGGVPISVDLTQTSDTAYTGHFNITGTTVSGTAWAVFSARDMVGNRGTEIDEGQSILIDTDGPSITRLVIKPEDPVKNDENQPVLIHVVIGLNEAIQAETTPELYFVLSGPGREPVVIESITGTTPDVGDVQAWEGDFVLPADGGLPDAETLSFEFIGTDALDNIGTKILCNNAFQVYQGNLPPLEAPIGLTGESLPGGKIRLIWNDVEGAAGYQLYRQAPSETELSACGPPLGPDETEFIDEPVEEGEYAYAVASIREENGEQSLSGLSETEYVESDATAPPAPLDFSLSLASNGIVAQWTNPAYQEIVTFSLYRSDSATLSSVEGLSPVVSGIPMENEQVVDPNPSSSEHCYVITAVDEAGNESLPSDDFYLNFSLLPVSSITVTQSDNENPVITWTPPNGGSVAGYDFAVNTLDPVRLTDPSYTDTGYSGDTRTYAVTVVDENEAQSPTRSLILPVMDMVPEGYPVLKRGIMNRLEFFVHNQSIMSVDHIRLKINVGGHDHTSEEFSLGANETKTIPVVIGGYDDLPDVADMIVTAQITPNSGETVQIVRSSVIDVVEGMLVLQILNEEFIRGGTGTARFTLENTGEEEIEIITAQGFGGAVSGDICFELADDDDNVISVVPFMQALGDNVLTLSNGDTLARIPAGDLFTSCPIDIPVPAGAPDDLTVRLVLHNIYHHHEQADEIRMTGLQTTHSVTLTDTSYYAEVTGISPESSTGDEPITITGMTSERLSEAPIANAPVKLVIRSNGFNREYDLYSDENGIFSHTFVPGNTESGIYQVWALHPDLADSAVQGEFFISRISVNPKTINLQIPANYTQHIGIKLTAGNGTVATNLRLSYEAEDQPDEELLQGVHVTMSDPVNLTSNGKASASIDIWADNTAPDSGVLVFKVKSDETGDEAWETVTVNLVKVDASPVLYFTPNYIETGIARGDQVMETVIVENKGLADLENMHIDLISQSGEPAPEWAFLNSTGDQGTLTVGEKRVVDVSFFPSESVAEGIYYLYLRVTAANYPQTDYGVYVSVTQSGVGSALLKISDIYTGTLDPETGLPVQGLAGAKISLQNEKVISQVYDLTTDSLGEAFFADLPAGRYKCRITADNHQEKIARIWIKPGITATQEVFLDYNLVTVEWSVNEITIQDKYEIVLTATYETDVPAAVLVIEPMSVTLPKMEKGDVFFGEFTLTNHGLIRADDITYAMPKNDPYYHYEFLDSLPDSLGAKESIQLPYRVVRISSTDDSETATGGGSGDCGNSGSISYTSTCANDYTATSLQPFIFSYANHDGCNYLEYGETISITPMESTFPGGGPLSYSPGYGSMEGGGNCLPCPEDPDCPNKKDKPAHEPNGDQSFPVGCSVNTFDRQFSDDSIDLSIKVKGGVVTVHRYFKGGVWYDENTRQYLKIIEDQAYIPRPPFYPQPYPCPPDDLEIPYPHEVPSCEYGKGFQTCKEIMPGTLTVKDVYGNVTKYVGGHAEYYSTPSGILLRYLYEIVNGDYRLRGIADRDNNQVLWYEYNDEGLISRIYDNDNRQVEYDYIEGKLTRVLDVLGNETFYEYDNNGKLTQKIDAAGRETIIAYNGQGDTITVVDNEGNGHFFEYDYKSTTKEYYALIRSSSGRIKEVWYNDEGDTIRVDINGRTIRDIEMDGRHFNVHDEKGNVTRKELDEWYNTKKIIRPDSSVATFKYNNQFQKITRMVDPLGNITEYDYDEFGNLTEKTEAVGTSIERITTYTYNDENQLVSATIEGETDEEDVTALFTYDDRGNLSSLTDPMNNTSYSQELCMGN